MHLVFYTNVNRSSLTKIFMLTVKKLFLSFLSARKKEFKMKSRGIFSIDSLIQLTAGYAKTLKTSRIYFLSFFLLTGTNFLQRFLLVTVADCSS